jgi:hypothetical protein
MKKEGVGARKACTVMQWEHVKVTTLDSRRRGKSKASMDGTQTKILTLAEEEQLCIWIKVQGQNLGGANRQAVARKVVEIIWSDQSREEVDRNHDTRFVVQSPAGVEKGTAEYWKAKYQDAERVKCNLQETPILPADCKVLQVPKKAIEPASRTAVESKQGSFYFRNLVPDAQKRKDDKEEETERKKQRKEDASDRKSAKEAAQEAAVELWESENEHLAFCVCWVPGAKALYKCATKHLCGQCLEVKSCVCRAKKCKDGRSEEDASSSIAGDLFESATMDSDSE